MIRKIIAQGKGAHTITLPSKWITDNSLKAGDEVKIIDKDRDIIITAGKDVDTPTLIGRFSTHSYHLGLATILGSYYRRGYDELSIEYKTDKEREVIEQGVGRLIGYEIVDEKNKTLKIKRVASATHEEYQTMVRKSVQNLKVMSQETIEALKEKDPEKLKRVIANDAMLNKFSDYARHIIMKDPSVEPARGPPKYGFLFVIEKLGDRIKELAAIYLKKQDVSKSLMELHERTHACLCEYVDIFYSFSHERIVALYKKEKELLDELEEKIEKTTGKESLHIHKLSTIILSMIDATSYVVMSNI